MVKEVVQEIATEAATRTATDVLDKVIDNLTQATTTITQKLVEVSPEALEILLKSIQVQGIVQLIAGFLSALIPFILYIAMNKLISQYKKVDESTQMTPDDKSTTATWLIVGVGICILGIVFTSISTFCAIINQEAWIKTIYPEAHITLALFEKINL